MKLYEYGEPVEGLDAEGNRCTACRLIRMTRADVIVSQRVVMASRGYYSLTDDQLVDEWCIVHWASEVTPSPS